jgi:hypothetical protein
MTVVTPIPGRRFKFLPRMPPPAKTTDDEERERRIVEIQRFMNIDNVNQVFSLMDVNDRNMVKLVYAAFPMCMRCGKYYREMYNLGKLECPIRQHLFRAPNNLTGKYLCCKRPAGSLGCLYADHVSTSEGFYAREIVSKIPLGFYKAFVFLGYNECPKKSFFTENVTVAVDAVIIERLETRAFKMLDQNIDRKVWLTLSPQLQFNVDKYHEIKDAESQLDWSDDDDIIAESESDEEDGDVPVDPSSNLNWD